jgi:S1-C subfamily serine protease
VRRNLFFCFVGAAFGALLTAAMWNRPNHFDQAVAAEPPGPRGAAPLPEAIQRLPPIDAQLTPEERVNVAVYEAVNRSVVNIVTKIPGTANFLMLDNSQEGAGSGSTLDKQGHILTNFHVIEGAKEIQVTLFDGSSYEAKLVGRDVSSDVAVIQIEAPQELLFPVTFGDSTHLRVGQKVYAIGNPFGLDRTLTTGIVSSLNRSIPARNNRSIKSVIQIDAAINPGNSGGPLLNTHGQLIGMNTAIASRTGQNTGVGFAIAASNIVRVVPELIEKGHVVRPETGITRVFQQETTKGLFVATMTPGGPAEQAGLRGFRVV